MIREGEVRLSASGAFYNPAMAFNRTLSALAVEVLKPEQLLDGFCASGCRGLRYAVEGGAKKVTLVDYSEKALKAAKANLKANGVKAEVVRDEFNRFCYSGRKFDFVEADPFGSPVPFIAAAINALKRRGTLSVTATDLANLCSPAKARAAVCRRQYGAEPLHCDFTHEIALRILVGKICREAAARDRAVQPLACWHEKHYSKAIVALEESSAGADTSLAKLGFVSFNPKTLDRREGCVKGWKIGGPLWAADSCDSAFLKAMEKNAEPRHKAFLETLRCENGLPPFNWDVHVLADQKGWESPRTLDVVQRLRAKGYRAVRSHYSGTTIKTNAPLKVLERALH